MQDSYADNGWTNYLRKMLPETLALSMDWLMDATVSQFSCHRSRTAQRLGRGKRFRRPLVVTAAHLGFDSISTR
jgi:hypothetical protein